MADADVDIDAAIVLLIEAIELDNTDFGGRHRAWPCRGTKRHDRKEQQGNPINHLSIPASTAPSSRLAKSIPTTSSTAFNAATL